MVSHSGQPCPRLPVPIPPTFQPVASPPTIPQLPPRNSSLVSTETNTHSLIKALAVSPALAHPRTPFLRKIAKRRPEATRVAPTPRRTPPQPPQTLASPQINVEHIDDDTFFCPEDCTNTCCKPVRFINSPTSLTSLPTFTEVLP